MTANNVVTIYDQPLNETAYKFPSGEILIRTTQEVLTIERALFLAQSAIQKIMEPK